MPVFLLFAGIIHAIGLALLLPMLITLPGPDGETAPAPEISPIDVVVLPPPQPLTDVGPEETSALPSAPHVDEGNATGEAASVAAELDPGEEAKPGEEARDDIGLVAPEAEGEAEPAPRETKSREVEPSQVKPPEAETPERDGAEAIPKPTHAVANITPAVAPQTEKEPQQTEPSEAGPSAAEVPETGEAQQPVPAKASPETKISAPAEVAPRTAKKSSAQRKRTAKPAPRRTASRTVKSPNTFAPFNMFSGLLSPPAKKRK